MRDSPKERAVFPGRAFRADGKKGSKLGFAEGWMRDGAVSCSRHLWVQEHDTQMRGAPDPCGAAASPTLGWPFPAPALGPMWHCHRTLHCVLQPAQSGPATPSLQLLLVGKVLHGAAGRDSDTGVAL